MSKIVVMVISLLTFSHDGHNHEAAKATAAIGPYKVRLVSGEKDSTFMCMLEEIIESCLMMGARVG